MIDSSCHRRRHIMVDRRIALLSILWRHSWF